jgi:hypothetical protein
MGSLRSCLIVVLAVSVCGCAPRMTDITSSFTSKPAPPQVVAPMERKLSSTVLVQLAKNKVLGQPTQRIALLDIR